MEKQDEDQQSSQSINSDMSSLRSLLQFFFRAETFFNVLKLFAEINDSLSNPKYNIFQIENKNYSK